MCLIWPENLLFSIPKMPMQAPTRLFDFPRYQLENKPLSLMMTSPNGGQRLRYSTQEFVTEMDRVSRGLIALGMEPGDRVALISHNNRCEWNLMDHGVLQAGGIDVPLYPTMTEQDYLYILNHSGCKWCFVSNRDLFEKVQRIQAQVPSLLGIYTFEQVPGAANWQEVLALGTTDHEATLRERAAAVAPTH